MRGNTGNRPTCRRPCPPKPRMSKPLPVTSDAHNHRMQPRPRRAEIHRAGHRAGRPICASMTRVTEKERCKETRVADPPAHDHDPARPRPCPPPRMQPRPRRAEIHRAGHRAGRPICASVIRGPARPRPKPSPSFRQFLSWMNDTYN